MSSATTGDKPTEQVPTEFELVDPNSEITDPKTHQHATEKYQDGRSPSAWALSGGGMVASVVIMIGAMGPHWVIIWIGIVLFVISAIVSMVLSRRGLSNRVR